MNQQNICRYFASTGKCFYGDQCNFSHTKPESTFNVTSPSFNVINTNSPEITQNKVKKEIPCRNVSIHGYCKFVGKGCEYLHFDTKNNVPSTVKSSTDQIPLILKRSDKINDMVGQFQNFSLSKSSENETNLPRSHSSSDLPDYSNDPSSNLGFPYSAPSTPNITYEMNNVTNTENSVPRFEQKNKFSTTSTPATQTITQKRFTNPQKANPESIRSVRGGTTYFYGADRPNYQNSINIHYNPIASSLPHTSKPGRRSLQSFFMPEDLRQDMLRKSHLIYKILNPEDKHTKDIPSTVHHYHSLFPLDHPSRPINISLFGYATTVYKAISSTDGLPYVLRKIENFRLSNEQALRMADRWKHIQNPNIVGLNEVFISKDFGEVNSLFFVYNYHPGSETLEERFFSQMSDFIPEPVLWSYILQVSNALRIIHSSGLSCRGAIYLSKILLTGKNRIRLNCVGINDVINFDGGKNLSPYQHEDLLAFGKLILILGCKSLNAIQNLVKSVDYISSRYSEDLKNLVVYLLSKPTLTHPSIEEVISRISNRMFNEAENLYNYADLLESDLSKELENGRLFRLMIKLGFINERPEYDMGPSWSETGDRYLLKLFRDYVFHQTYEDSTPVIDWAHVIECLNKLDAGVPEKIVLMSRDEQSLLIVSYKDLKRCIEEAFNELQTKANQHFLRTDVHL